LKDTIDIRVPLEIVKNTGSTIFNTPTHTAYADFSLGLASASATDDVAAVSLLRVPCSPHDVHESLKVPSSFKAKKLLFGELSKEE
jgi:hypothetical protein